MQKAEKKPPASDGRSGPTAGNKLARPSLLFARRKADKAIVILRRQTSERDTQLTNHSQPYFARRRLSTDAALDHALTQIIAKRDLRTGKRMHLVAAPRESGRAGTPLSVRSHLAGRSSAVHVPRARKGVVRE
jgi:hypothetical protein